MCESLGVCMPAGRLKIQKDPPTYIADRETAQSMEEGARERARPGCVWAFGSGERAQDRPSTTSSRVYLICQSS